MMAGIKQAYLVALIFSSILAWTSFFSVIFFTNPQSAGFFGVAVLGISATLGLLGLSIILWQIIKLKKK